MARTFLDRNLMSWEVYPSGGKQGYSENPHVIFNCLSNRAEPPRYLDLGGDEATAQRALFDASDAELNGLLEQSRRVD